MSKQVIVVDGEETVVREDTAKAFRGVHWALLTLAAIIVITALIFLGGFIKLSTGGPTGGHVPAEQGPNR